MDNNPGLCSSLKGAGSSFMKSVPPIIITTPEGSTPASSQPASKADKVLATSAQFMEAASMQ